MIHKSESVTQRTEITGEKMRRPEPKQHATADGGAPLDEEMQLAAYLDEFTAQGRRISVHIAMHPVKAARAASALGKLPVVEANLHDFGEGAAVRGALLSKSASFTATRGLSAVLSWSCDSEYVEGASKQTLRRKVRAAEKLGVRWRRVTDADERRALLAIANAYERSTPRERYRTAEPDNDDLLSYRMWLVAESADGTPLLLAVTPYDGDWAVLRYFRTLSTSDAASNARYLMTRVLVSELSEVGVHHLVDSARPHWLSAGLRHFQRMVGFRMVRLRLVDVHQRRTNAGHHAALLR